MADIGLDIGWARANLVQAADIVEWWPERDEYAHKWQSAVRVIAGSSTMTGAPRLVAHAAMRTGAGMVHLSVPGMTLVDAPIEIVQRPLPEHGVGRRRPAHHSIAFTSIVVGSWARSIRRHRGQHPQARHRGTAADGHRRRRTVRPRVELGGRYGRCCDAARVPTVLTPHDGEYALLSGSQPGS